MRGLRAITAACGGHLTTGILMANKNYSKWIDEAITSIINQSDTDWRLIIVDYGSTDRAHEIYTYWQGIDDRIKAVDITTESPLVPLEAHNAALAEFKADKGIAQVIKFDPDDVMYRHFIKEHRQALANGFIAAFSEFDYIDAMGNTYEKGFTLDQWAKVLPSECKIPETAVVIREALDEAGQWFYAWQELGIMAVFDRYLALMAEFGVDSFKYIDDPLFGYRQHTGQLSQIPHVQRFGDERQMVVERYQRRLDGKAS